MTYDETVAAFRPEFGNANHILASRLITQRDRMQKSLKGYEARQVKPPRKLITDMDNIERRIISLLKPQAEKVAYKGPEDNALPL